MKGVYITLNLTWRRIAAQSRGKFVVNLSAKMSLMHLIPFEDGETYNGSAVTQPRGVKRVLGELGTRILKFVRFQSLMTKPKKSRQLST